MSSGTRLAAMTMAAVMVLAMSTPALASTPADIGVAVGNTTYTVSVTHEGAPVGNAPVDVEPTDPPNSSYGGASGVTDASGEVTFDLPLEETEVAISVTVDGDTTTTTEVLPGTSSGDDGWDGEGPFGRWVSQLVQKLMTLDADGPLGQLVSEMVTSNNPGSEHRSDRANPGGNGNGPPAHAGSNGANGNGGGPPDHANNDT